MAFRETRQSGSTSGFSGFSGFGQSSRNTEIDTLLEAARAHGGSLEEVVNDLTNPRTSIMSTVGNGFKRAFSGFVEAISVPGQIVAGMVSSDKTISEAIKENLTMSDVLYGEKDKYSDDGRIIKAVKWAGRFATDTLFDPLTYVSFGASRGLLGVSALNKISVTEKLASKVATLVKATDDDLAKELVQSVGKELTEDEIGMGVKQIKESIGALSKKKVGDTVALSEKGHNLLNKYIENKRRGIAQTLTMNDIKETLIKKANEVGKKFTPDELTMRAKKAMDNLDDAIIESTVNSKLSRTFVEETMANMLTRHPALMETLLDKGGVKLFGKSILSGQRVSSVIRMLPGVNYLDNVTQPFRNKVHALFDTNYSVEGRRSEGVTSILQRSKDLAESTKNKAFEDLMTVGKRLRLDDNELDLVLSALEGTKNPADKKLSELWKALQGYEYDKTIIRPEVFQGTRFFQKMEKNNLKILREAGVPISNLKNHVRHFVKENVKTLKYSSKFGSDPSAAKFAKVSTFIDDAGKRIAGFVTPKIKRGVKVLEVSTADDTGKIAPAMDVIQDEMGKFFEQFTGKQLQRAAATVEEAKKLGVEFEDNAFKIYALASQEATKTAVSKYAVKEIAEKFGRVASEAPEDFVPLSAIKTSEGMLDDFNSFIRGVNGEEILFAPDVAKNIEEFFTAVHGDEATDVMLKAFDKIQNIWKASVTSIWPAFHGRNAISNVFLHFLDLGLESLKPATHMKAINMMMTNNRANKLRELISQGGEAATKASDELFELNNKIIFKDVNGVNWSFGELQSIVQKNVVAFNPSLVGQIDVSKSSRDMVEEMSEELFPTKTNKEALKKFAQKANPLSQRFVPFQYGRKLGNAVEDQARLVSFLTNLEHTGNPILAAERTKMFLFDYQNLTKFEKTVMRRLVPFYTFTRKNLELQAKSLLRTPGRITAELRMVTTLGDVLSNGERLTDEEKKLLPDFMQNSLTAVYKKNGSEVGLITGVQVPIEAAFSSLTSKTIIGSVTPLVKLPVELSTGYSFFAGKPISDVTNASAFATAPDVIKDFIGFTEVEAQTRNGKKYKSYVSLRPERMYALTNLPPTSGVLSKLKQLSATDTTTGIKIMQGLIGARPYSVDLEAEADKREKALKAQIEDLLTDAKLGYKFTRFNLNK